MTTPIDLSPDERQQLHDGVCPRHRDTAPGVYVCGPCEAAGDAAVAAIVQARVGPQLAAMAWWVAKWGELRGVLAAVADRVDEFTYDEFAGILDDEPVDHEGEPFTGRVPYLAKVLAEHADCVVNTGSVAGSGTTGMDLWSCGLRVPFVDDLDEMERLHLATALAAAIADGDR